MIKKGVECLSDVGHNSNQCLSSNKVIFFFIIRQDVLEVFEIKQLKQINQSLINYLLSIA